MDVKPRRRAALELPAFGIRLEASTQGLQAPGSARRMATFKGRVLLQGLAVAVAGLALGGWALRSWQGPQLVVETVQRRDLVQTVVASGRVLTARRVDVGTQVLGTVKQVRVAEGQVVAAGQPLVELDAAEAQASVRSAEAAVAQAQARLRQLRELSAPTAEQAQRQAQATLDVAQAQLQRSQDLFKQGFIGEAALQEARKNHALAQAQWQMAGSQAASVRAGGSDVALAEQALAQAQANAAAAAARLNYTVVRAPVAGQLIARNVEAGDVVQAGRVLFTLSPAGKPQLAVDIDEKNLRWLALGQPAWASADAYAQHRFAATVAFINPGINAQTGAVEVKLDVPQPPDHLKQDMTVSVDIEVARRPQALVAPVATLHDADTTQPWVLRVHEGRAERRVLKLGLRAGAWAEVLQGAEAGDQLLQAAAKVQPGGRVRAAEPPASSARPGQ